MSRPAGAPTESDREATNGPTREIADAIARAYKEVLGRGPKATVHFASPATLVVVLENTMTIEERTLAALGEDERLRERRLVLTGALEDRFRSIVERVLGRRTLAFVGGIDTRRDVAVDIFTLEPEPADARRPPSPSSNSRARNRPAAAKPQR